MCRYNTAYPAVRLRCRKFSKKFIMTLLHWPWFKTFNHPFYTVSCNWWSKSPVHYMKLYFLTWKGRTVFQCFQFLKCHDQSINSTVNVKTFVCDFTGDRKLIGTSLGVLQYNNTTNYCHETILNGWINTPDCLNNNNKL